MKKLPKRKSGITPNEYLISVVDQVRVMGREETLLALQDIWCDGWEAHRKLAKKKAEPETPIEGRKEEDDEWY